MKPYTDSIFIWLDAETKEFYKQLAQSRPATLSDVIREVLNDYKNKFEQADRRESIQPDPQGEGL